VQLMSVGAARRILLPFCIGKRAKEDCDSGSEIGTVYNGRLSGDLSG